MDEKTQATEATTQPIATEEAVQVPAQEDLESKNAALEAEKNRLIEEAANYKLAYLKEAKKNKAPEDEDDDDRMRRIASETLANSRLAEIAREQDALIKKALKENSELKRAVNNRTDIPASVGTHSEGTPVKDTMVTADQISAFKARGWSDKDIERYKANLRKNSR